MKMNCWEFKKCGRQPGGPKSAELGVCPASTAAALSGAHGGENAGRACWVVAGSLCGGKIQGTYATKLLNCWKCEFMNKVKQEEDLAPFGFSHTRLGMERTLERQKNAASRPTSPARAPEGPAVRPYAVNHSFGKVETSDAKKSFSIVTALTAALKR